MARVIALVLVLRHWIENHPSPLRTSDNDKTKTFSLLNRFADQRPETLTADDLKELRYLECVIKVKEKNFFESKTEAGSYFLYKWHLN